MAKQSKAKSAGKAAAALYALKKLAKGAFVVGAVAAVGKVLRGNRAT